MSLYEQLTESNKDHILTDGLTHDEWLNKRMGSLGGSDAGAIMGLNKWASPLTVYLSKKGLNTFKGNTATARGNFLEEPIRKICREEFGCQVEEVPAMFFSNEHRFMSANIDGLIFTETPKTIGAVEFSGLGGHEIKTTERGDGFGEDEIPDSYYAQVQHYMAVLNLPWFIVSAYFILENTIKHFVVQRDEEFITRLIEAEKTFWSEFVEKDVMPAPSGVDAESDCINAMFEGSVSTLILDEEAESLAAEYSLISAEIKEKEQRKKALSHALKLKIIEQQSDSDEGKAKAVAGNYKLSFTKFMKKSVDSDRLKKDGLYEAYAKESEVATLRITTPKE